VENNYKPGESETRPWGSWEVIGTGEGFAVKRITVNPGEILSLQRHKFRSEHWIIAQGTAQITLDSNLFDVKKGDSFFIPVKSWHRIHNCGKTQLTFIEIQLGEILDESDIERKEDKYQRT